MKIVTLNTLSLFFSKLENKFSNIKHVHKISDVEDLQRRLDEITLPPNIETSEDIALWVNQLSLTVSDLASNVNNLSNTIDILTPSIGEIYITTSSEHPSVKFGGVWEQIKDMFLLAAGDTYSVGSTGGEATHTLTIDEMPSHNHIFNRHQLWRTESVPESGESNGYGASNKTLTVYSDNTSSTGENQSHNNMPPYLSVYVWKRIS